MGNCVMIVEDEILVGMMLKKKIEEHGFRVLDIVTTGEAAITAVMEQQPDLLLMDVGLPGGMDGITAAELIKEHHDIPVIFFTGNRWDAEIELRTQRVNPVAILDKMGNFRVILETVRRVLKS